MIEYIDLGEGRPNKIRERAGFMAYMFSDIRSTDEKAKAFSIVWPGSTNDAVEYASTILKGESSVVNWADDKARDQFLVERNRVADAV